MYCCDSRRVAATLNRVGDEEWLESGHGGGEGLQPMIKGSSPDAFDRVSIRSVLRGAEAPRPRRSRRRNKVLVGWLLYCATAAGGTAAAFTVRDTLFPSLGAPTDDRVWPDQKAADTTLTTEHGSSSTAEIDTTVGATVATSVAITPGQSVEAQTVPTSVEEAQGPGNSVDNRGSGTAAAPGTTVNPTSGPGPGTTVDDHPTDTSTPGSASIPPAGPETTQTSASTPAPAEGDAGHQNGKGGGDGGGGGDHGTSVP